MGNPQVSVDGKELDNGTWRRIVGWPSVIANDDGTVEKFAIEFIIQGSTAVEIDDRFASTFEDFVRRAPRVKAWLDDSKASPTIDWYLGDGKHSDLISIVSMLPEASRTARKQHFVFVASAYSEVPMPSGGGTGPATELGAPIQGLATTLEVSKDYLSSERYTLTTGGSFVSTLNESAEGPYDLASVANNSGKARFSLEAPDVIVASFDEGMFIDVSSPSAYEGRHFITAISGGGATIDTSTDYVAVEGDVGATVLVGTTTTAEDNFQNGKSQILVNLLETGTNGQPNDTAPHMAKVKETVSFTSERKDALEFLLVSAPQPMSTTVSDSSGNKVERGLNYAVKFMPFADWDANFVSPPVSVIINGRVSIANAAISEKPLDQWWDEIELQIRAEVESVCSARLGGGFRHQKTQVTIDYVALEASFDIAAVANYNGTLAYKRSEVTNDQKQRSGWELVDGYDYIQESNAPPRRMKTIVIQWFGDSGSGPGDPLPPTESGFTYLFDSSSVTKQDDIEDETGHTYTNITKEFHFTRWKLTGGVGGGGGGFGVGGSIAGLTGGMFGSGLGGAPGTTLKY